MKPADAFWLKRSFFMNVAMFLSSIEWFEVTAVIVTVPL